MDPCSGSILVIQSDFYEFWAVALEFGRTDHNVRSYKWTPSLLRVHCVATRFWTRRAADPTVGGDVFQLTEGGKLGLELQLVYQFKNRRSRNRSGTLGPTDRVADGAL
jgi:hypothetical protein